MQNLIRIETNANNSGPFIDDWESFNDSYCLNANDISITQMLEAFNSTRFEQFERNNLDFLSSDNIWGNFPSIRYRKTDEIEPITGVQRMTNYDFIGLRSGKDFFSDSIHHRIFRERVELRGPSYYVSLDHKYPSVQEKLDIIFDDIFSLLISLEQFLQLERTEDNFQAFVGILDYLKGHFLTLSTVLIGTEHSIDGDTHSYVKDFIDYCLIIFTRQLYNVLLGRHLEILDLSRIDKICREIRLIFNVMSSKGILQENQFKLFEIDHPYKILMHANAVATRFRTIESIIGITSGGVQIAICAQLMNEVINNTNPELYFLPISVYSRKSIQTHVNMQILRRIIPGKRILVMDDNVNSGYTFETSIAILAEFLPKSINLSVAELGLIQIMNRYKRGKLPERNYVTNLFYPDFETAVDIYPMTKSLKQLRRVYIKRLLGQ